MLGIGVRKVILALLAILLVVGTALAARLHSWDRLIPNAAQRFIVLPTFQNDAVLDVETGLVWQRTPELGSQFARVTWGAAALRCLNISDGGRRGWRLPVAHELASLVDPSVNTGLRLPNGHPFIFDGEFSSVWTATPHNTFFDDVFVVSFTNGLAGVNGINAELPVWCVRAGGSGPGSLR